MNTYLIFAPIMKKTGLFTISVSLLFSISCNNNNGGKTKRFPKPGTTIASAKMPITDDPLNKFTYAIRIIADSNIRSGVYDVDVDYGPNFAEGQFTMPKGGEDLKPIIRKGSDPHTYVIGFKTADDTTFYEYFEVRSTKASTKMQYLKGYTF